MPAEDNCISTVCPYCGIGCNLELHLKDDYIYKVTSPFDHPVNRRQLVRQGALRL